MRYAEDTKWHGVETTEEVRQLYDQGEWWIDQQGAWQNLKHQPTSYLWNIKGFIEKYGDMHLGPTAEELSWSDWQPSDALDYRDSVLYQTIVRMLAERTLAEHESLTELVRELPLRDWRVKVETVFYPVYARSPEEAIDITLERVTSIGGKYVSIPSAERADT